MDLVKWAFSISKNCKEEKIKLAQIIRLFRNACGGEIGHECICLCEPFFKDMVGESSIKLA